MQEKKVIIFDFDGVVIDSWELAYKMTLRKRPEITPEEHKGFFTGNIFKEVSKIPITNHISDEEQEEWLKNTYHPAKLMLPMYEGIEKVIERLGKSYKLFINSSASEASIREILERAKLDTYFEKIYGHEISKDKAEKFHMIMKECQVEPEECLLITDTVGDVLEAKHCSIPSLVVTYGYHDRSYFHSVGDEVIGFADSPLEILN